MPAADSVIGHRLEIKSPSSFKFSSQVLEKVKQLRQLALEEDLKLDAMTAHLERQPGIIDQMHISVPYLTLDSAASSEAGASQRHPNVRQLSIPGCDTAPCLTLPIARLNYETQVSLAWTSIEVGMDGLGECCAGSASFEQAMEICKEANVASNGFDNETPSDALQRMQTFCAQFRSQHNIETPKEICRMSRRAAGLTKQDPALNKANRKSMIDPCHECQFPQ